MEAPIVAPCLSSSDHKAPHYPSCEETRVLKCEVLHSRVDPIAVPVCVLANANGCICFSRCSILMPKKLDGMGTNHPTKPRLTPGPGPRSSALLHI